MKCPIELQSQSLRISEVIERSLAAIFIFSVTPTQPIWSRSSVESLFAVYSPSRVHFLAHILPYLRFELARVYRSNEHNYRTFFE